MSGRFKRCLPLLAGAWLAGSASAADPQPPPEPSPEELAELGQIFEAQPRPRPGELLLAARLRSRPAPLPARFSAPIQPVPAPLWCDVPLTHQPPLSFVTDGVCVGNARLRKAFLDGLSRAAKKNAELLEMDGYLFWLEEDCRRPEFCAWAARAAATARTPAVALALWHLAGVCAEPSLADLFQKLSAPPAAVWNQYFNLWLERRRAPYRPGLRAALAADLAEIAAQEAAGEEVHSLYFSSVRTQTEVLCWLGGDEANRALLELQAGSRSTQAKDALAVGLAGAADPRLRALHEAACKKPALAEDCAEARRHLVGSLPEVPADAAALRAEVRAGHLEAARIAAVMPALRAWLLTGLSQCGPPDDDLAHCLGELAALDWATARRKAAELVRRGALREDDPMSWGSHLELRELRRALERFPDGEALDAWLRQTGLMPAGPAREEGGEGLLAGGVRRRLARAGRVVVFETDRERAPVDYPHLARLLAAGVGADLDGVVFDQIPPPRRDLGHYALHAYERGQRHELEFVQEDAETDPYPLVAFVNALLAVRGSQQRLLLLGGPEDFETTVLIAPRAAFERAQSEGLLAAPLPERREDDPTDAQEDRRDSAIP